MSIGYYNSIVLVGIIGNEPERSFVKINGYDKQVCNFTLYVNDSPFQIAAWDKLASDCMQWKHKGDKLMLTGSIEIKTYTDKNNQEKTEAKVTARELVYL